MGEEQEQSQYTVKMIVYDGNKEISWVSQYLPEGITGTKVQKTAIYKDVEGKLVQINFWGELDVQSLETELTAFPTLQNKTNDGGSNGGL